MKPSLVMQTANHLRQRLWLFHSDTGRGEKLGHLRNLIRVTDRHILKLRRLKHSRRKPFLGMDELPIYKRTDTEFQQALPFYGVCRQIH